MPSLPASATTGTSGQAIGDQCDSRQAGEEPWKLHGIRAQMRAKARAPGRSLATHRLQAFYWASPITSIGSGHTPVLPFQRLSMRAVQSQKDVNRARQALV